jgi:hypothetical protein
LNATGMRWGCAEWLIRVQLLELISGNALTALLLLPLLVLLRRAA